MLELKVLRVYHSGDQEAKKLLPYIKECDLYCTEEAFLTEKKAAGMEAELQLKYKESRTSFHNWVNQTLGDIRAEERAYLIRKFDYLYVSKVPLWHLERFTDEESQNAKDYMHKAKALMKEAGLRLEKGDIDECINLYFRGMGVELDGIRYRDAHIGSNLSAMEEQARKRYPFIKEQSRLRVAMDIGGLHRPDRYTTVPLTMVDLRGKPGNPIQALWYGFDENKTLEEMKAPILARCLFAWSQSGILKAQRQDLMGLNFDELISLVRKNSIR